MNLGLFSLMPMLQTHGPGQHTTVEVIPDVEIVHEIPRKERPVEPKQLPEERKTLKAILPRPPSISPPKSRALEFPLNQLPLLPPAINGLDALPLETGLEIAANSTGTFSAGDLDAQVGIQVRIPPIYPIRARERRIEGWVEVKLLVGPGGNVERAEVVRAEPPGYFEKSVLDCVKKWKLTPPTVGGEPVRAWMSTKIRFKLE
jgi:protein TonB